MSDGGALDLEQFLPYRLSLLANAVSRQLAGLYADKFDLRISEWRAMAILASFPGVAADEVAQRTAMDKVAVSRAVARLAARGWITKKLSPVDRRRSVLRLSAVGQRRYRQIVPLARRYENRLLDKLAAGERAGLDAAIRRLSEAVEDLGKNDLE